MLEEPSRLGLNELSNHVAEDSADGVEALVGSADIVEAVIVEEDLLDDEDGHGLTKFRARLHDAQAERDDLGCEEEVDDLGRIILNEGADNTQASETKVFERSRLGGGVEEGVEEEGNVR